MTRRAANVVHATGYETMRSADGLVLQAGIPSRSIAMHKDVFSASGWITRAVVIKTYYTEEDKRCGWTKGLQRNVLCDVRTYGRYSRPLAKVPVLQRTQGLHDRDIYIPRDSRQNLEGGELVTGGSKSTSVPTAAENMDGDHVLIGFLDNDPSQPVILPFQFSHPKSSFQPELADGRVREIRHQGTLLAWDKDGNFTIDATGVAEEILEAGGTEKAAVGKGTLTFVNQDAGGAKLSVVLDASSSPGAVLLGSDPASPATEPFVCGNLLKSLLEDILDTLASHKHTGVTTGSGVSGIADVAADWTAQKGQIPGTLSDFIRGKKAQ